MTIKGVKLLATLIMGLQLIGAAPAEPVRVEQARTKVQEKLGQHFGKPVFIRIFKEFRLLEIWLQEKDEQWHLLDTYFIMGMSGELGPKTQEGDEQAPEGFYRVTPQSLNPYSNYHLSFNIGYPNKYDRELGRTGSYIMIHGGEESIGCFAMTDAIIEEIYTLVNEAFKAGVESIPVQIYPFSMTPQRMKEEEQNPHYEFWQHLLPGYNYTETHKAPYPDKDFQ